MRACPAIYILMALVSFNAIAEKSPSKSIHKKIPETFSAIDATSPVLVDQFISKTKPKDAASQFELIPSEHTDSIISRLKIIEELVRDFGRAYDYRVHTTSELKSILTQLKALQEPPPNSKPEASSAGFAAPEGDS